MGGAPVPLVVARLGRSSHTCVHVMKCVHARAAQGHEYRTGGAARWMDGCLGVYRTAPDGGSMCCSMCMHALSLGANVTYACFQRARKSTSALRRCDLPPDTQ